MGAAPAVEDQYQAVSAVPEGVGDHHRPQRTEVEHRVEDGEERTDNESSQRHHVQGAYPPGLDDRRGPFHASIHQTLQQVGLTRRRSIRVDHN